MEYMASRRLVAVHPLQETLRCYKHGWPTWRPYDRTVALWIPHDIRFQLFPIGWENINMDAVEWNDSEHRNSPIWIHDLSHARSTATLIIPYLPSCCSKLVANVLSRESPHTRGIASTRALLKQTKQIKPHCVSQNHVCCSLVCFL